MTRSAQQLPGMTPASICGGTSGDNVAELLEWHSVAAGLPDADTTVMMWVADGTEHDWAAGWWDGECWRGCDHGGPVAGTVTHWADPEGPNDKGNRPA